MAHFAKVEDDGTVSTVCVVDNDDIIDPETGLESEDLGIAIAQRHGGGGTWVQTSYGGNLRGNYAGIGMIYDSGNDCFHRPRPTSFLTQEPLDSWNLVELTRNGEPWNWEAPTAYPDDGKVYEWNEPSTAWVEVT